MWKRIYTVQVFLSFEKIMNIFRQCSVSILFFIFYWSFSHKDFLIEIRTARPILVKFGRGINFDGRKVLSWVLTLKPDPQDLGCPKQGLGCICSLNRATSQKLYKTKVVGQSYFSGARSHFWNHNLDLEGPRMLLELFSIIFRQSLLNKSCSTPSQ